MIQAIGLSSATRRGRPPAVDDLTFEARAGQVTALLGPPGSGKSTALRLMLQLTPGRGVALFRGRPLSQVPHPSREIGALLGDVPGHPRRTALGHLRMLAAAAGLPPGRAGDVLEVVGLSGLADQRLGRFSRGMDRRLGLAAALLGDPHTLVLDEPGLGLSPRETAWLHGLLRGYADQGGAVLITARDAKEAARIADRVVSLRAGRLIADQVAEDFARTRLRPRVAVHTPHADRLAAALAAEFREAAADGSRGAVEVVRESGSRLAVYGSSCAAVGEVAYRHRVVVHQLADQIGDSGDRSPAGPLHRADGRQAGGPAAAGGDDGPSRAAAGALPPRLSSLPPPGPTWPLRYELRRWSGVRTGWWVMGAALLAGLVAGIVSAAAGVDPAERALTGWPEPLLLPPVAMAAGLLGALSFGQEFRYPALAPARVPVPRRLSLLGGKLAVSSAAALLMSAAAVAMNSATLSLLFGGEAAVGGWCAALCSLALLSVECAWAGVLAAGIFRSTLVGLAAVAALPLALAPALRAVLDSRAGSSFDGLAGRMQSLGTLPIPSGVDRWLFGSVHLASQPIAWALVLSLAVLLCGYALISLRNGVR
ncbi:ATP-binding cassette domain-containing protein [Streptomyces hoynatensis]|uniref:ATP-binding cassette domain-containing protein n=1 Tax=Streptomyces hoynatensis TaxID=1141874 RepID=A0A3A9YPD5_9ACTN|nr:ATP-binding cassette domain-containing protein [Streptomyces hoynatensis]RKN37862.1 ATP-binding cassette domain-containing protein [Streptomyces hoynatensis]